MTVRKLKAVAPRIEALVVAGSGPAEGVGEGSAGSDSSGGDDGVSRSRGPRCHLGSLMLKRLLEADFAIPPYRRLKKLNQAIPKAG